MTEFRLLEDKEENRSRHDADAAARQLPSELERLLELDGPSVVECFEAVEQARKAIAEAVTAEAAAANKPPARSSSTSSASGA